MTVLQELVVLDTPTGAAEACLVCGNEIPPGGGVTARYGDRILRFKCPGCVTRFKADPERYLAGNTSACCGGEHDH